MTNDVMLKKKGKNNTNWKDRFSPQLQTPRRELKNPRHSGVFLTNLEVFGNVVKEVWSV